MHSFNLLLFAGGLLVFLSLLAGFMSTRLGLSFLLVFLVTGMLVGVDGPGGLRFDDSQLAAWVGSGALAIILLEGGVSTSMKTFRTGLKPAAMLASFGVVITAAVVGAVGMAVMQVDWRYGLLLGAIVGSTDAAAVFSLLRQSGLKLNERLSATLELESGMNDPMAVFLVLTMIEVIKAEAGAGDVLWLLARQVGLGTLCGAGGGLAVAWLLKKVTSRADVPSLHGGMLSLIVLSAGVAVFAGASLLEGSGFLAVYLFGLMVRERAEEAAHAASSALDGFAWASQASMFLLLGLLVAPHQLLEWVWPSLAIALMLMFVARPLAVWLCLKPLKFSHAECAFVGWVGLRGAVPIVLALFPLLAEIPDSWKFFNVAFVVVLLSLLMQGTTMGLVAKRLGVVEPPEAPPPEQRPVQGRLTIDASEPLADVFQFFQLPIPDNAGPTLADWLTDTLARGHDIGDGLEWHGARFEISGMLDGRISRVGVAMLPTKTSG